MATRIPSIKAAPDDGLDVMKAVHPPHPTEDDCLENERALRVPATFEDPDPEARQGLKEPSSPAAIREVVEQELASRNPKVQPLPLGILANTNSTVKVGAIVLMDGVPIDPTEPTICVRQPLQPRVLRAQLSVCAVARHKVPAHTLRGNKGQRDVDWVVSSCHRATFGTSRHISSRGPTSSHTNCSTGQSARTISSRGTAVDHAHHPSDRPTPRSGGHTSG